VSGRTIFARKLIGLRHHGAPPAWSGARCRREANARVRREATTAMGLMFMSAATDTRLTT